MSNTTVHGGIIKIMIIIVWHYLYIETTRAISVNQTQKNLKNHAEHPMNPPKDFRFMTLMNSEKLHQI